MPHILPGSIQIDGDTITAAVHTGPTEFDTNGHDLRYVRGSLKDGQPGDSVASFLGRIYDNSEGCVVKGTFRMVS